MLNRLKCFIIGHQFKIISTGPYSGYDDWGTAVHGKYYIQECQKCGKLKYTKCV